MKNLLGKLEAIEEEHSGLGDTGVREQMREHVHRAFLEPETGFVPSGEYGLSQKANRRVAAALTSYCLEATKAAMRDGLLTVEQRLAAFQDPGVAGPGGATFEDYFGVVDGTVSAAPAASSLSGRRAVRFDWPGTLDDLCAALNAAGPWQWFAIRQYRAPFLESHPGDYIWGRIRPEKRPGRGYVAEVEAEPGTKTGVAELLARIRSSLERAGASKLTETNPK
jgi:hypothetical protein